MKTIFIDPSWATSEIRKELETVKLSDLQNFVDQRSLKNSVAIEALIFGRYECDKSGKLFDLVRSSLDLNLQTQSQQIAVNRKIFLKKKFIFKNTLKIIFNSTLVKLKVCKLWIK